MRLDMEKRGWRVWLKRKMRGKRRVIRGKKKKKKRMWMELGRRKTVSFGDRYDRKGDDVAQS